MESYPQIKITHNIGNTIEVPNQIDSRVNSYMSDNVAIGAIAIPVDNAIDFSSGDILLLLSSLGAENCEIIKSTAHSSQSFTTLVTAMPHSRGDSVKQIKYDQIVIHKSATIDGVYAVLGTYNFNTTNQNTIIFDSAGLATSYYKVQWKNSLDSGVSTLSDPISVSSYSEDSVGNIIFPVLKAMGVDKNDNKITTDFCLSAIQDARLYVEAKLFGIRHAWRQEFEYPIKLLAGTNYVDLPGDIDFKDTDRSILAARLLIDNIISPFNLNYIPKRTWNIGTQSVAGGSVATEAGIGDVELILDNAGDFPNTTGGVAYVATTDYNQTILQINYTGVDLSTNKLTGVTGITRIIPVGTRVWSRPTISQPVNYTIYNNRIYFDRIIPDSMQGKNIYVDYYKKLEVVNDINQVLAENYREIYKWYLRYAIKYRKDLSLPESDPDLVKFNELVDALFNNLYTGQDTVIIN